MSAGTEAAARRYAAFLERIAPDTLDELAQFTTADVHFRDPFNDLRGQQRMRRAFADVFRMAEEVRYHVRDLACSGDLCFLLWEFTCRPKRSKETWRFQGVSEVRFDDGGKVKQHIDHFDAGSQVYARLPLLGTLIRLVRRRLQVRD